MEECDPKTKSFLNQLFSNEIGRIQLHHHTHEDKMKTHSMILDSNNDLPKTGYIRLQDWVIQRDSFSNAVDGEEWSEITTKIERTGWKGTSPSLIVNDHFKLDWVPIGFSYTERIM